MLRRVLRRLFERLLARRAVLLLAVLGLSGILGAFALRVRTDQSVEAMFPVRDPARETYDRYRGVFPHDDARVFVMVEGPDLFTPEGLRRVSDLEDALDGLPHVIDVLGPLSTKDVKGDEETIRLEKIFPSADLEASDLARRVAEVRADPVFAYALLHPERNVASIEVTLDPVAARHDVLRREFHERAMRLIRDREREWERLVISGVPSVRARYIEMLNRDVRRLVPVALLLILAILAATYRSARVLGAALVTMVAAVVWTVGLLGIADVPIGLLTSFTPIAIMVISISDTVHIVTDADARLRAGARRREAVAAALADCAGPCLVTELVIAAGFLSLALVNIRAIGEFGVVTAAGMLLAWLANMSVLPLVLSTGRERPQAGVAVTAPAAGAAAPPPAAPGPFLRAFGRFVRFVERQVVHRPALVVLVSLAALGAGAAAATRIEVMNSVYDDLRPDSDLYRDLRFAEAAHGGIAPLVIFLEAGEAAAARSPFPALEPEAVRFLDRAERRLRASPHVKTVSGVASYLRKAHSAYVGEEPGGDGLPRSRALAAQEVVVLDRRVLRDVLGFERRAAAVVALLPDLPSPEVRRLVEEVEAWAAAEAPPGYRVSVTGSLAIVNRVARFLVQGLLESFGAALLLSAAIFAVALRSVRLAIVGLIPNVAPSVFMLAVMAALGIHLKPSTVVLFSIALTIADDDTIQFLARFRRRFEAAKAAGGREPHAEAAVETLRESALPMAVTAATVSTGFLILLLSEFQGNANLGLVMGVTLFSAVFADLFLLPVILRWWRPRIGQ